MEALGATQTLSMKRGRIDTPASTDTHTPHDVDATYVQAVAEAMMAEAAKEEHLAAKVIFDTATCALLIANAQQKEIIRFFSRVTLKAREYKWQPWHCMRFHLFSVNLPRSHHQPLRVQIH